MIGDKIRELREENNLLLRELAASLEVDAAILSKMERGERLFKKVDILRLSQLFKYNEKELLTLWLADKIIRTIQDEDYKGEALFLATQMIKN